MRTKNERNERSKSTRDNRVQFLSVCMILFAIAIVLKLFVLQVFDHGFYSALASGQHEMFQELFPERGNIYMQDTKDKIIIPVATNQKLAAVYADPRRIEDPEDVAEDVGELLGFSEEKIEALAKRLDNPEDPYEQIGKNISDDMLEKILDLGYSGIGYIRGDTRLYPEPKIGGHILGFIGSDSDGALKGKYGIEGYFDELLTGTPGFLRSERDISGRIIATADRSFEPAKDGADIILTIDRNIQYMACTKLETAVKKHSADGGSVVIIEPSTGNILAMCGSPDFDPNNFSDVDSINQFNNPAIFQAYEPGSIFKPITMAAAIDSEAVDPNTTFIDTGEVYLEPYTIRNSDDEVHGEQNMTQVLEKSINTGVIFAMRETTQEVFKDYLKAFGFGEVSGIEIETEMPGNISALNSSSEIYFATASFGQGITATPLQLALAYAAIANDGLLKPPRMIEEIRYGDVVEKKPIDVGRQVISEKSARMLGAMLVSVIEHGHGQRAGVPGYYIGGKTGTAQVANAGGYAKDNTIGSFAGFGPVGNPAFAMVVRIDHPRDVIWAESTAAPLFGEIADFLLRYKEIPSERGVE